MTDAAEASLARAGRPIREILARCLAGHDLRTVDALPLMTAAGADLDALVRVADRLRQRHVGDVATYVVNRNINFTNECVNGCGFCAFSRPPGATEGIFSLAPAEVIALAREAHDLGATEVCIQAGLAPGLDGPRYVALVATLHRALPDLHIHACSPEEVRHAARRAGISVRELLVELKAAGLGSMPGTAAEILDDDVRRVIAPARLSSAAWVEVITTAHELGIPTTATMMYGHVETAAQRVAHLDLLRTIQAATGGFTELVPLAFVHHQTPLYRAAAPGVVRPGPDSADVLRVHAVARLMLGPSFRNIQASWVKEGLAGAGRLLQAGANDLGGTLMSERISAAAGARHGQLAPPTTLRRVIRAAGRVPAERDTAYRLIRTFARDAAPDETPEPLERLAGIHAGS